jgi:hypothetical protein
VWYLLKGAPYRAGTFQRLARFRFTALVCSGPTLNIPLGCECDILKFKNAAKLIFKNKNKRAPTPKPVDATATPTTCVVSASAALIKLVLHPTELLGKIFAYIAYIESLKWSLF